MAADDPFGLPAGYGGTEPGGGSAAGLPGASPAHRPRSLAALEAEMRAQAAAAPAAAGTGAGAGTPAPAAPPFNATIVRGDPAPSSRWPWARRWRWLRRLGAAALGLVLLAILWLAITAPLSKSLQPIAPPQLTLLSADGRPIARNGAEVDAPVDVRRLPRHVAQAFIAIEDRRFYSHWGIDPRGMARAMWTNLTSGGRQGGSTITQQLAKNVFLDSSQTYGRKGREILIAWWMEAWLTKDEILSRYLSNAYFGDNMYGLRAASMHYFHRQPERLTLSQAAMLAGLVKAPSRLAPTRNLARAQAREALVIGAMVDVGYLSPAEARAVRPATTDTRARAALPSGTYFADWAMPQARQTAAAGYAAVSVRTTLDARLQDIARRVTARAELGSAQVALVAMRPNGEVVAMVGGRSYRQSPFNRATQARRQPGSTFKLIVYYAALRAGMTPDSLVDDSPITAGSYRPANYGGTYRGEITLREAFARSSNVAAVRLYTQLGSAAIAAAARDLGITTPLPANASVALGTSDLTLIELTAAYAAMAADEAPVRPHALRTAPPGFFASLFDGRSALPSRARSDMLVMLRAAVDDGTGRGARLAIPAFGKTGTTQDSRDALFVGFADDLVVGVWVGNDDNRPIRGLTGGGIPARIWRDFMTRAIPAAAPRGSPRPRPEPRLPEIFDDVAIPQEIEGLGNAIGDSITNAIGDVRPALRIDPDRGISIDGNVGGAQVTVNRDGVAVRQAQPPGPAPSPPARPPAPARRE